MKINNEIDASMQSNEAFMNILQRVSVRAYTDTPLTDSQVTALLHAAMSAPSGVNRQPWEFVMVDDRATLDALAASLPYAKMAAHAPLAIVVCGNKERFLDGVDDNLWEQDCSAASENILLAAHALGLGGVWTCLYPHADRMAAAARLLHLPADIVPFNLIPVGHPARTYAPLDKWVPSRIHLNRYRQ